MFVAFYLYQDKLALWRWYLLSVDQTRIANSVGGYADRASCVEALRMVMGVDENTPVYEEGAAPEAKVLLKKSARRKKV